MNQSNQSINESFNQSFGYACNKHKYGWFERVTLKGLFHPACLTRAISWFAFIVTILMAHENGDNKGHEETTLLRRWSADPIVLTDCDSEANQRWGLHCHAHLCYCFLLLFSVVKQICILHHCHKSLLRMRSGALLGGFLEARNIACSYP